MSGPSAWFPSASESPRPEITLFCFPHTGADATAFRGWQEIMGPDVEVLGAALPGRGRRLIEPLVSSIEQLAEHALEPLLERAPRRFALLGHSMGALVAFELAHRLSSAGRAPDLLVLSGSPAPGAFLGASTASFSDARFLEHLADLGGLPDGILEVPELVELMLPIMRNDYEASEAYRPAPASQLAVPLLVLGGDADPLAPRAGLEDWSRTTCSATTVTLYPGGHFFLVDSLGEVMAQVREALRAQSPGIVSQGRN